MLFAGAVLAACVVFTGATDELVAAVEDAAVLDDADDAAAELPKETTLLEANATEPLEANATEPLVVEAAAELSVCTAVLRVVSASCVFA
jgi:hypothetical protein